MIRFAQELVPPRRLRSRNDAILEACRGKTVLHLGFVDEGLMDERIRVSEWLHAALCESAKMVVGVDISEHGVQRARELGFQHCYLGDVERLSAVALPDVRFDVVLAADIIEHVANPGLFLSELSRVVTAETEVLLTTPNALALKHLLFPPWRMEVVHPDHNCYYSPATLTTLLRKHGFQVKEIGLYSTVWAANKSHIRSRKDYALKLMFTGVDFVLHHSLVRLFPFYGEGMLFRARQSPTNTPTR